MVSFNLYFFFLAILPLFDSEDSDSQERRGRETERMTCSMQYSALMVRALPGELPERASLYCISSLADVGLADKITLSLKKPKTFKCAFKHLNVMLHVPSASLPAARRLLRREKSRQQLQRWMG